MNRATTSFIAALVTATVLSPRASTAMNIQMFDLLMDEDQREYVEYLVEVTRRVFIEMNQKDAAEKVEVLFEAERSGGHQSVGERQIRDILQRMRSFNAERPNSPLRFDVEGAMLQTLVNNGIDIPNQFRRNLDQRLREKPFWPRRPTRKG
ncbi:MAG: hypothetical protein EHM55_08275 [Acidobacteria bacterium]|nr:MAG: hypothetical protein EHM55_08275 [Acidobacteriota bacterium]